MNISDFDFKIWDEATKKMYANVPEGWWGGTTQPNRMMLLAQILRICVPSEETSIGEILLYTGRTDFLGNKMYDGDIIRKNWDGDFWYVIEWNEKLLTWALRPINDGGSPVILAELPDPYYVEGNRFQHAPLLEK